jgi:conjugal transfer pilus assembly protein TraW
VLGIGSAPMMASARDFGSFGPTWSIAEPDLLAVIKARLEAARQNGTLDAMNQRFVEATQATVRRPHAVAGITCHQRPALEFRSQRYAFTGHPRCAREPDCRAGPAFQSADPSISPTASPSSMGTVQRSASGRCTRPPDKLWIVLVKGSPTDLMKATQRRFYFDQMGSLTGKFGIAHTPALLVQQDDHLDIREVALPVTGERAGDRR